MNSSRTFAIGCFTLFVAACGPSSTTSGSTESSPAPTNTTSGGTETETTRADAGATSASATPMEASPEPSAAPSSSPPPATPSLALGADFTPTVTGLPAISADGATVAVGDVAHDGLRGAPNLTLRLFDARTGAARPPVAVLSVAEGVRASSGNASANAALHRTVDPRLTRAQTAIQGYRPLTPIVFETATFDAPTLTGHGAGLDVVFTRANGEVNVTDSASHATRYHATFPAVRRAGARSVPNCENAALVREAWTDANAGLIVIHVEYSGTDTCVSPDGSYRVARLTAPSASPPPSAH